MRVHLRVSPIKLSGAYNRHALDWAVRMQQVNLKISITGKRERCLDIFILTRHRALVASACSALFFNLFYVFLSQLSSFLVFFLMIFYSSQKV